MRPMKTIFLIAIIAAGCSKVQQPINVYVNNTTSEHAATQTTPSTTPIVATGYPEKTDVERLLIRARELEQKGQFESAFALVNQALELDANSPSATALKSHLEEIIKRI